MGPLDRLPQNALAVELRARTQEMAELKGSFQALGSSSVRTHRIFSEAEYDFQFTASAVPGTLLTHRADIEFIPNDLTLGGAFCHRVEARIMDTSNNTISFIAPDFERQITHDGTQKWSFYHYSFGFPSDSIRLKLYFFTTGSGTFTVNVLH